MATTFVSAAADFLGAVVFVSGGASGGPLGSGSASSIAGVCGDSCVITVPLTGRAGSKLTHKRRRARLVKIREEAIRFELVTAAETSPLMVNTPSAPLSSTNTLVDGPVPVETNTVAVDEVECRMLLTVLDGFGCGSGRSHIGN